MERLILFDPNSIIQGREDRGQKQLSNIAFKLRLLRPDEQHQSLAECDHQGA